MATEMSEEYNMSEKPNRATGSEYESEVGDCDHCGEFVVVYAPFLTDRFEPTFCPNCGERLE